MKPRFGRPLDAAQRDYVRLRASSRYSARLRDTRPSASQRLPTRAFRTQPTSSCSPPEGARSRARGRAPEGGADLPRVSPSPGKCALAASTREGYAAAPLDKSYRATPVSLLVGRYLRWFRNEWGATATTLRDYEAVLARMSLTLADKDPLEVTVDDLREVIDLWADREARTRAKVTSIVRAFWSWAEEHDQVPFSPAAKLRRPRAPRRAAPLLPQNADARLLNAAQTPRDRVALLFLLDLGVRRAELAGLRVCDIDLSRRQVTVFGKGQKSRVIPLRGRIVLEIEAYMLEPLPLVDRQPEPDDFILYPEKRTGGGRLLAAYPKRRVSPPTIHRWWYRHAQAAGLVGAGMTRGLNMHRARHSFATDLRRAANLGAASQALGHSDLSTTAAIYGHYDLSDLERAMDALARARRERDEPAD